MEKNISERLIVRYLAGETTAEEAGRVEQWLKSNPQNQKIMKEWEAAWDAGYDPKISFDEERGLQMLNAKLDGPQIRTTNNQSADAPKTFYWLRVAAAVAILFGAAFLMYRYQGQTMPAGEVSMVEKINPYGIKSTFRLSDGSLVKLNAGSQLRFPKRFSDTERTVYLEGEAYFDVVRDESKPFKVVSEKLTTEVLGTSFAVRAFPEAGEALVVVTTGKVKVSSGTEGASPVVLRPLEKVVYHKQSATMTKSNAEGGRELAWKDDVLLFEETPLGEVSRMLEQWYGVEVRLDNADLENCTFTGRFKNESLNHVLEAVRYSVDITIKRTENLINMSGKGCKP